MPPSEEPAPAPSPTAHKAETLVYGSVLALALAGGAFALYSGVLSGDAEEVAPTRAAAAATPSRERGAQGRPARPAQERPAAPPTPPRAEPELPDFVPDLPDVPDLATEPPPPRPAAARADPRMQQLGVEMRLLSQAREQLVEHPARAYGVLERHRRQFPDGILEEEREAHAIQALVALEHVDEAERRYYDFRARFPASDFTAQLIELMERPPHEVGAHGGR